MTMFVQPWTRQPQSAVRIDPRWGAFKFAWLPSLRTGQFASTPGPDSRGMRDVGARGKHAALTTPGPHTLTVSPSPTGQVLTAFSTNNAYGEVHPFPTDVVAAGNPWTLLVVVKLNTLTNGAFSAMLSQKTAAGWAMVALGTSSSTGTWYWSDNNNGNADSGLAVSVGEWLVVTYAKKRSTNQIEVDQYGTTTARRGTIALTGDLPTPGDVVLQIGAFSGTNGFPDGSMALMAIADAYLPVARRAQLGINPWQMFAPIVRPISIYATAAAAANDPIMLDPLVFGAAM